MTATTVELPAPPRTLHWQDRALCTAADPELFFPEKGGDVPAAATAATAKQWCRACPVTAECLAYALDTCPQGIWGGTSDKQRQRMRAEAGAPAKSAFRDAAPCGTPAAYRRHYRKGEQPCEACSDAEARRQQHDPNRGRHNQERREQYRALRAAGHSVREASNPGLIRREAAS